MEKPACSHDIHIHITPPAAVHLPIHERLRLLVDDARLHREVTRGLLHNVDVMPLKPMHIQARWEVPVRILLTTVRGSTPVSAPARVYVADHRGHRGCEARLGAAASDCIVREGGPGRERGALMFGCTYGPRASRFLVKKPQSVGVPSPCVRRLSRVAVKSASVERAASGHGRLGKRGRRTRGRWRRTRGGGAREANGAPGARRAAGTQSETTSPPVCRAS